MKDLKEKGIHPDTIRKLVNEKKIEKVKAGLYKLTNMPILSNQGMIDISMSMPKAVVCLHSALAYYELTTTMPDRIMIGLPREEKPSRLTYPPTEVFYFSTAMYKAGIDNIETGNGTFKIYIKEKTIVDCFRYRNKLGKGVAIEGLKNYLSGNNYNINKLMTHAKIGRMSQIIKPYVESIIG